jgi:hypothetical protein
VIGQLLDRILPFEPKKCLDLFGGTGMVSYALANEGIPVHYNELLPSSCLFFRSLMSVTEIPKIEYLQMIECPPELDHDLTALDPFLYEDEIAEVAGYLKYIHKQNDPLKGLLLFILTQAVTLKQGGSTFHKSSLNRRNRSSPESTWNRPLSDIMTEISLDVEEFLSGRTDNLPLSFSSVDALSQPDMFKKTDLVFVDPPYPSTTPGKLQLGNYVHSYHIIEYLISQDSKLRKSGRIGKYTEDNQLVRANKSWLQPEFIRDNFKKLIDYSPATIVLTFRPNYFFAMEDLLDLLDMNYNRIDVEILRTSESSITEHIIVATQ